ncbi:hypothetical protein [Cryobacterium sp. GrIS_2_6]|uniref:hypothetical protein n=1 Tax=Cryobacterium sp. GrIS_2_6 TaxID=3162785 RepID=UPI002E037B8D|nr:hypothetical protein [Cryobacterium psychrotolerans]
MSSRRQYIDSTYLTQYLSGTALSSDYSSADDLISAAEEYIDAWVGHQDKFFRGISGTNGVYTPPDPQDRRAPTLYEVKGRVSQVINPTNFILQQYTQFVFQEDYLAGCWIEIIGGTGAGQTNHVTGSLLDGQVTVSSAWTTAIDATSVYRIYQLGKFPRLQDVYFDSINQPVRYYKMIPDAVRRATAAQCVFMNAKGRDFFDTDGAAMQSEHLGAYSYSRGAKSTSGSLYIAPDAKEALRGITNRMGKIQR